MPQSMAGMAGSLASAGRQTGTTMGVAIARTVTEPALAPGPGILTVAAHGV
jgi:hypothetical protein